MKVYSREKVRDQEKLEKLGYKFVYEFKPDVDIVIDGDKDVIQKALNESKVKLIQLQSAGFDYVDIKHCQQSGVILCNARDVYSYGIAEFVLARLLEENQMLIKLNQNQAESNWDKKIFLTSLKGMKVGILGTGSIAKETAKMLGALGSHLVGFNTRGTEHEEFDNCYPLSAFDEHAAEFDILIITLPLNVQTRHYLNKERMLKLKKDLILVNIARGPIIHEQDLVSLLDTHFKSVILDVFEEEPLDKSSPLWLHPKVRISPHISYKNNLYKENLQDLITENLTRYIQNKQLLNRVC